MKKRGLRVLCAILGMVIMLSIPTFAEDNVKVYVDNVKVEFDVQPQLIGGRTMVPLRAIFEALGATVQWDGETKTITAYNEAYFIKATIDNTTMTVNSEEKQMDIAPMIVEDRTLVPARFVAEAFDCNVDWDGETKTVSITTKEIDYSEVEKDTPKTENNTDKSENKSENKTQNDSKKQTENKSNKTIAFNEYSFDPTREVQIECTNTIRGSKANTIINSENRYNDKPNSNQEWIIMEFNVKYISSTDGENDEMRGSDIIYKDTFFTEEKNSLPVYDMATLGDKYGAYGVFKVNMYPGSSSKIVIGLLTDKYSGDILLKVPNKNGNDISWIKCIDGSVNYEYEDDEDDSYSESHTTSNTGSSYYQGTSVPTYTSATGINLKNKKMLSSGDYVYMYNFTSADDVGDYWSELEQRGWYSIGEDEKTTRDVFESGYHKGNEGVIVNVYLEFNEVWVLPYSINK